MLKDLVKDIAARRNIARLADSMLGRALLKKLVSLASEKLGAPLEAVPSPDLPGFWMLTAGAPGADLHLHCHIRTETLAEIAELAARSWLQDSQPDLKLLQAILIRALNTTEPRDGNSQPPG